MSYIFIVGVHKICGTTKKDALEITGLSSGTSVSFDFVTYTDDSQTTVGYTNTGLWISDQPSGFGSEQGKLVYKRGPASGTATVSTSGSGIYAYTYPYSTSGSWCLSLTVSGMVVQRP